MRTFRLPYKCPNCGKGFSHGMECPYCDVKLVETQTND